MAMTQTTDQKLNRVTQLRQYVIITCICTILYYKLYIITRLILAFSTCLIKLLKYIFLHNISK